MEINEKNKKKEQQALIIRKYQQYLKLEKSLSPNTLDAYLTDLDKLMNFLTLEGIDVLEVCLSDLQRFAAGLHDIGIHPRSQARILSGIKSFFRFLIMADYLEADPSELLEGPKIGLKLPEVLTVEEIDNIIAQALKINELLQAIFDKANLVLVDFKLEFGRTPDGKIILADEISPDTCRLWDKDTHEKLDKDRFRRDLGGVEEAYIEVYNRLKNIGL